MDLCLEITVNGESVKPDESLGFNAGEMINIGIWLKNHMRDELDDILLSLDCFQDYQNGKFNYRLDSRFAVIGNDAIRIPKVNSSGDNEKYGKNCNHYLLIF